MTYKVSSDLAIDDYQLYEGKYYYYFKVIDIFGLSTFSKQTTFNIKADGKVTLAYNDAN